MKAVKIILVSLLLAGVAVFVHSCKKKEKEYSVLSVSLDQNEVKMGTEETLQLTCEVKPLQAKNHAVKWSSSNEKIASVSQDGLVTSLKLGQTIITVTTVDGGKTDTCHITVTNDVFAVRLDKKEISIGLGEEVTLKATVLPAKAENKKVIWKSDSTSVATVDINGKVKGIAEGKANIIVTSEEGNKTDTCIVHVVLAKVTGVVLNKNVLNLAIGESETLIATIQPTNATNKAITWESDKPAIASVDANGKVTVKAAGAAVITVTTNDGGFEAKCSINATPVAVNSVTLDKTNYAFDAGGDYTFTATVLPANATNKAISWKSSDTNVVKVDASGRMTSVGKGSATITVTTADGNKTATCNVTVDKSLYVLSGYGNVYRNSKQILSSHASSNSQNIKSFYKSGGYIYTGGVTNQGSSGHAEIWSNGIPTLNSSYYTAGNSEIYSVFESGGYVYGAGYDATNARIWRGSSSYKTLSTNGKIFSAVMASQRIFAVGQNANKATLWMYDTSFDFQVDYVLPDSNYKPVNAIVHNGNLYIVGVLTASYQNYNTRIWKCAASYPVGTIQSYMTLSNGGTPTAVFVAGNTTNDVYIGTSKGIYKGTTLLYTTTNDVYGIYVSGSDVYYCVRSSNDIYKNGSVLYSISSLSPAAWAGFIVE